MALTKKSAQHIYQGLLDDIGNAIIANDPAKYAGFFLLPHRLQTYEKSIVIANYAELETHFNRMKQRLQDVAVEELSRLCTMAEHVNDETISGCHETRLIDRNFIILETYISLSTLKLVDGHWKVSDSQYAEPTPSLPTLVAMTEPTISCKS